MDINAAEVKIVERIIAETGAKAISFPEDPEMYVATHAELIHLVRYESTTWSEPVPNRQGVIIQEAREEFVIISIFRHLTKHGGMYEHLEALRLALTGYTIPDVDQATILFPVRRNILKENKGLWYYQSVFAMSHPEAET
jgi:hypothetical protein